MSGTEFDADWLTLRAPFDAAAGKTAGPAGLARVFGRTLRKDRERSVLKLHDLAGGTAANVARLAPFIPGSQHWTVIDSDPALLARVGDTIAAWARSIGGRFETKGDTLSVTTPQRVVTVMTRQADLRDGLAGLAPDTADGVTGSALFDLVSRDWLAGACAELAQHRIPALFTLTVDGRLAWQPESDDDTAVAACFFRDMRRDKGFGPALGGAAPDVAAALFAAQGYRVETAQSDWQVGPGDRAMHAAQLSFVAAAACEQVPEGRTADDWRQAVAAWKAQKTALLESGRLSLAVGHRDLLAVT